MYFWTEKLIKFQERVLFCQICAPSEAKKLQNFWRNAHIHKFRTRSTFKKFARKKKSLVWAWLKPVKCIGLEAGGLGGLSPPQYFEWGGGGLEYPLAPPILYPYSFRLKRGLKLCIFSSPNKIFLGKGALPPCNPQNRICINFDRKETEIVHLWFPK